MRTHIRFEMYIGGIEEDRKCFAIPAFKLLEGVAVKPTITLATDIIS